MYKLATLQRDTQLRVILIELKDGKPIRRSYMNQTIPIIAFLKGEVVHKLPCVFTEDTLKEYDAILTTYESLKDLLEYISITRVLEPSLLEGLSSEFSLKILYEYEEEHV